MKMMIGFKRENVDQSDFDSVGLKNFPASPTT